MAQEVFERGLTKEWIASGSTGKVETVLLGE